MGLIITRTQVRTNLQFKGRHESDISLSKSSLRTNLCVCLYLQSVRWAAGASGPASVCRNAGTLCCGPGCGGAAHTQWTTAPAPINTPSQTQWHCRLARYPIYYYTRPFGQTPTHTAPPHTLTTPRTQPETKKRARTYGDYWYTYKIKSLQISRLKGYIG